MLMRREFLEITGGAVAVSAVAAGCAASMPAALEQADHRPWPLPQTRWVLYMRWHELLFLHWPVRAEAIRPLIPTSLKLDTFDGFCWIGIVPFRMSGVRLRYAPLSMDFPELNVRTYVKAPGRSGVWFFSLDAASWLAVTAARWLGMPYYHAAMTCAAEKDSVRYESGRTHRKAPPAKFHALYGPTGEVYRAAPGSFDQWLTERYCLFAALRPSRVVYGEIHHPQWSLQPAEVEVRANTMAAAAGIELSSTEPVCHFSRYQEVVAWPIVRFNPNSAVDLNA